MAIFGNIWSFLAILDHFGPFGVIFGPLWGILGNFWPFLGHFVAFLDKFAESSNFIAAPLGSGNSPLECMLDGDGDGGDGEGVVGDDDGGDDVVGGRICFEESDLAKVVTRLAPRGVGELQIQRIHNDDYKSTIVIITKTRCRH